MATKITSREFNQNTSGAKRAADRGPVYITDRGRPAHVLLTYEAYEQLLGTRHIVDRLADPPGVENIEFTIPTSDDVAQPASFE